MSHINNCQKYVLISTLRKIQKNSVSYDENHNYSSMIGLTLQEVNFISPIELRKAIIDFYSGDIYSIFFSWEKVITDVLEEPKKGHKLFDYLNNALSIFSIVELKNLETIKFLKL